LCGVSLIILDRDGHRPVGRVVQLAKEKAVNNPNKDGFLEVESQRRMDNTTPRIKY
jgi:hypothetical protein